MTIEAGRESRASGRGRKKRRAMGAKEEDSKRKGADWGIQERNEVTEGERRREVSEKFMTGASEPHVIDSIQMQSQ